MAFSLEEKPNSRSITNSPPTVVLEMTADGEFDEWIALAQVESLTPLAYNHPNGSTLYRQDIRMEAVGFALFDVTVPYGTQQREEGSISITYDTGGASVNVKYGRAHVNDYDAAANNNTNEFGGLINVTPDGVEGTDIVIPALRITATVLHPSGFATAAYYKALAAATGTTNSATFRTFAAGELLYIGSSGADGTYSKQPVTYNFIASQNVTGLTIGPVSGISKKGHDFLWVAYQDVTVGGVAGKVMRRVSVERMYEQTNFSAVFGWS